ncbi:MAG: ATP-grasp domain-containing protein [Anaeromyxobacter sp.]|nr:ATP-grasp domain-containing protein [Anaeromyxobacter sp.]MBL0278514.1 ATP-grasp domain-containing protein [Anaeromyxobacter sp.]
MSAAPRPLTVAVTGLNATDNPAPGVGVIRALRAEPAFGGQVVGLAYDALDSGLYHQDLDLAGGYLLPYPSQGVDALRERLRQVHAERPLDVIIPTLDSELAAFIELEPELRQWGIRMFLPSREQLELRSKVRLADLGQRAGLDVPAQAVLSDAADVYRLQADLPYPLVVKGVFYGATVVRAPDEAAAAFHATVAKWGLPVIAQRFHEGEEYDVVAVGDGRGGMVGAVPMKKLLLSDKGKGWAGVAVKDPHLLEAARRFFAETRWRGPCELEILKTREDRYLLIEVNPRFPAWCFLSAGAGQNLPWAVVRLARGEVVPPMTDFRAGTLFVRISLDQIASMADFQALATAGALPAPAARPAPASPTSTPAGAVHAR